MMRTCPDAEGLPEHWRVLVTGITSIHGWPIYQALQSHLAADRLWGVRPPKAHEPQGRQVESFCITDRDRLIRLRDRFRPTHVVHCAGVCDLDVCEERPQWAQRLNVGGTEAVAEVFGGDRPILYLSTDLVFSGEDTPPGGYTEHDPTYPVSVAGRTFAEAERLLDPGRDCVVRLGLPLGPSLHGDKGAVDWIESRFRRGLPVTLFYDEVRSCPSCTQVGQMVLAALRCRLTGLYHGGGVRRWSLHEIGEFVLRRGSYDPTLLKGQYRHQEVNGPPRIGDVSLDSSKLKGDVASVTGRHPWAEASAHG